MIDDDDIDSFFDMEKLERHLKATGGAVMEPSRASSHYVNDKDMEALLVREPKEDQMIKRLNINFEDYNYLSVERGTLLQETHHTDVNVRRLLATGQLPEDISVRFTRDMTWERKMTVKSEHVVQPGKTLVEKVSGDVKSDFKLIFPDTGDSTKVTLPSFDVVFARHVLSYDFDAPSQLLNSGEGTVVELVPHNNIGRGSVYRDVISLALVKANLTKTLDFGSGLRRYCDCMDVSYHVDIQGEYGRCNFDTSGHHCTAVVSPVIVSSSYNSVVCVNSLQNLSFAAINYLCQRWCTRRIMVVWPSKLNSDECDPSHLLQQYFPTAFFGFLGDYVRCPWDVGRTSRVFLSGVRLKVGRPLSNQVDEPHYHNSRRGCEPSDKSTAALSINLLGIRNRRLVGVVYGNMAGGKPILCADFLVAGKVHVGETVSEALFRECKEELDGNFKVKPVYFGRSDLSTSNHTIFFYYHEFSSSALLPVAMGTDKLDRGITREIDETVRLRDDHMTSIRGLVGLGLIDSGYAYSLEDRWLKIRSQSVAQGSEQHHSYYWDRYVSDSMRNKVTPCHNVIGLSRYDKGKIHYTPTGRHFVTNVILSIGDILVSQRGFFNSNNLVFYNGRLHARFKIQNTIAAVVVEVYEIAEHSVKDCIVNMGGLFRKNNFIWYEESEIGFAYFKALNRCKCTYVEFLRKMEEMGYCQGMIGGLPMDLTKF